MKQEYSNREEKAAFVAGKYAEILVESVLDVGADECHLRGHLPEGVKYTGVGLGGNPDQELDLEKETLPFEDDSFHTVICLDVLEHLDNVHDVFDELCRVAKNRLLVSLPNAYASVWKFFIRGDNKPGAHTKFYDLPPDKPEDRHKWFFSIEEARAFVRVRAEKNGMEIESQEVLEGDYRGPGIFRPLLRRLAVPLIFRRNLDPSILNDLALWVVLKKKTEGKKP